MAKKRTGSGPTTDELAAMTGMTFRQLDYWARIGYLRPIGCDGSGSRREYPPEEVRVARTMARLVRAGVLPAAANRAARESGRIADDVWVLLDEPAWAC